MTYSPLFRLVRCLRGIAVAGVGTGRSRALRRAAVLGIALSCAVVVAGCKTPAATVETELSALRSQGKTSRDVDVLTAWYTAELLQPGGQHPQARRARKRLDDAQHSGLVVDLLRGIDDYQHGRPREAERHFMAALVSARTSDDPRAPLVAWYAADRVLDLKDESPDFSQRHAQDVSKLLDEPGNIGFRTYALVADMWADMAYERAEADVDERLARRLGCVPDLRLAGPFGATPSTDIIRSFPAERPGPWPVRWEQSGAPGVPRQLETETIGCDTEADEPTFDGVFYGETFVTLEEPTELILSASGAVEVWVNDRLVHDRDVSQWAVWPKFGVRLHFQPGRHRVLWKMDDPATALRVTHSDGRPYRIQASADAGPGYSLVPQKVGQDPNLIMNYLTPEGVKDPKDLLTRFVAAYLANLEGQADAATVLMEPLVENPEESTGIALNAAANYVEGDPIFDRSQTRELVHELQVRAEEKDSGLWYPRLRNALWEAEQKGAVEAVSRLRALVKDFPQVSYVHYSLARQYQQLGWGPELERTVINLVQQFPKSADAVALGIEFYEAEGNHRKVDELLERLVELEPDTEVILQRALARKDYQAAIRELERLAERRPSRKDIPRRIEEIMVRAGNVDQVWKRLRQAIQDEPRDVHARLSLADAKIAEQREKQGAITVGQQVDPLAKALVGAVQAGAEPTLIEEAIDLIEGLTALEPYRIDALAAIEDYENSDQRSNDPAVRVLDYGAVWVRSDGSSRFLSHEVVRIQSEEAIKRFTETNAGGDVLHLRVIKADGTILEPEAVAGKSTATMPHLEVGDYVEEERIISRWGNGIGDKYLGPTWLFREENVAYARSEFVIISPKHKELQIEALNGVPEPEVTDLGSFVLRRYRVDDSPAAPNEPNSPPVREFMPQVSVGWGMSFDERIEDISRGQVMLTPRDPRIVRVAQNIVKKSGKGDLERARRLYHWVLDSVQDGQESDGRRVVISRTGNRWQAFVTLCRALDIPVRWALAESSLASPITGPLSSAQRPLQPLLVVGEGEDATWLTMGNKYSPFGTVPSPLRGQPAYLLGDLQPERVQVPSEGGQDGIRYEGTAQLRKDGSAEVNLRMVFLGAYAASLRQGLAQVPEAQLRNVIESNLLGQELQGARLEKYEVRHEHDLDMPLIFDLKAEVPQLATRSGQDLLLEPPFMPRLTQLTPLAKRTTPLMLGDSSIQGLDLKVKLPEGMSATVTRSRAETKWSRYEIQDRADDGVVHLVRDLETTAGRVSPEAYSSFQRYTVQADTALGRPIRVR